MAEDRAIKFYNTESTQYSQKRYEGKSNTYFQYLFKKRLSIFLSFFNSTLGKNNNIKAMEIGCADGVVIRKLLEFYDKNFNTIVGVDISPEMVTTARGITNNQKVSYFVRGEEPKIDYDLIFELGVHTYNVEKNLVDVSNNLSPKGYFMYSVCSINSLHVMFKLRKEEYINDYKKYEEYEKVFSKYFDIISSDAYGLFIPKLWAFPQLARFVQPVIEVIFKNIMPNLFHEKVYLLRKK